MSMLTHTDRPNPQFTEPFESARRIAREPEAPDRGDTELHREAPEARIGRRAEAPDAGDGRVSLAEHEFTEGRSQS